MTSLLSVGCSRGSRGPMVTKQNSHKIYKCDVKQGWGDKFVYQWEPTHDFSSPKSDDVNDLTKSHNMTLQNDKLEDDDEVDSTNENNNVNSAAHKGKSVVNSARKGQKS